MTDAFKSQIANHDQLERTYIQAAIERRRAEGS